MKRSTLDDLIRAESRAPARPSSAEAKSTWSRIEHDLGVAAVPLPFDVAPASVTPVAGTAAKAGLLASVGAKVTIATVVVGGSAALALPTSWTQRDAIEPPARVVATAADAPEHAPTVQPEHSIADPEPVPATETPLEPVLEMTPSSEPLERITPPRNSEPRSTPSRRPARGDAVRPEGIGAEIALVKRAGQALSIGNHGEALRLLDEHAREFPQGAMTEDRSALRVLALCAAGRTGEGQRARQNFLARWPRSVHAERLEDGCSTSNAE
jgi:hypothetical protein